jgi:hypothetical protein
MFEVDAILDGKNLVETLCIDGCGKNAIDEEREESS